MLIRFWGTRGSIPSPGPDTARYGGNTPCLEIVSDGGTRIILDAGTGARMLGSRIVNESPSTSTPQSLHVFLTHCHWDHVQGLPFFEPLRTDGLQVNFRLPAHMLTQSARILETQLDPLFFSIALEDLRAKIVIEAAHEREEKKNLTGPLPRRVKHPRGWPWALPACGPRRPNKGPLPWIFPPPKSQNSRRKTPPKGFPRLGKRLNTSREGFFKRGVY